MCAAAETMEAMAAVGHSAGPEFSVIWSCLVGYRGLSAKEGFLRGIGTELEPAFFYPFWAPVYHVSVTGQVGMKRTSMASFCVCFCVGALCSLALASALVFSTALMFPVHDRLISLVATEDPFRTRDPTKLTDTR